MIPQNPDIGYVHSVIISVFKKIQLSSAAAMVARAIKNVEVVTDTPGCETLAIANTGTVYINRDFWNKNIKQERYAEEVLLHELFHHALGDFKSSLPHTDPRVHLAKDARINAAITEIYCQHGFSTSETFFEKYYTPRGISGLLRPNVGDGLKDNESLELTHNCLYQFMRRSYLYDSHSKAENILSADDIYRVLCLLFPAISISVSLIGSGGEAGESKEPGNDTPEGVGKALPDSILDPIRKELADGLSKSIGHTESGKQLIKLVRSARKISADFLQKYSISQKINRISSMWPKVNKSRSPIPISPSARDLSKMVLWGVPPMFWNNIRTTRNSKEKGVAIYLDVSGSVRSYLPKIIRLITNLDSQLDTVFCFSTILVESSVADLKEGKIDTSGGTDFECVGQHILDKGYEKCLVITDGHAYLYNETGSKLERKMRDCAVVLFGHHPNRDNWFSKRYDTYDLKEVVG